MNEEIRKSFSGDPIKADAKADIDLINKYTLRSLEPEEVFAFNVNLCDDQPDRDDEQIPLRSLRKLATMFLGKPLIQNHEWSANNQRGRIYRAQVIRDGSVNRLRASIYLLRTPGNEETISQIEGGILKEVSVGFLCGKRVCSICGAPMVDHSWRHTKCENEHEKGEVFDGRPCLEVLEDPSDAFEVSLVAVPAQREAGITKGNRANHDLSPEEWSKRRKVFEGAIGSQIPDDLWEAVKKGKVSSAEVAAAFREEKQSAEKKYYSDFVPKDSDSYDAVLFALIPDAVIDEGTRIAALRALGFCRKELELQPISIRWYATANDVKRLGLDLNSLRTFRYNADSLGMASRQNPNQVLIRYPRDYADLMKTIYHECWHTFQMRDEFSPLDEDGAYWYMDDAYKRYIALSEQEKEQLF